MCADVSLSIKQLPEPMLTWIYVAITSVGHNELKAIAAKTAHESEVLIHCCSSITDSLAPGGFQYNFK